MATLLITHDMGVVAGHSDRVFVMYAGREAETGTTADIFREPRHRYTVALLDSVLRLQTPRKSDLATIPGRPPDLTRSTEGCPFVPRCAAATSECSAAIPPVSAAAGHRWRCYHPAVTAADPAAVTEAPR